MLNLTQELPIRTRVAEFSQMLLKADFIRNVKLECFGLHWSIAFEVGQGRELFQPVETARNPIVKLIRTVGVINSGRYWLDQTQQGISVRVDSDWNSADYAMLLQLLKENGYNAEITDKNRILIRPE